MKYSILSAVLVFIVTAILAGFVPANPTSTLKLTDIRTTAHQTLSIVPEPNAINFVEQTGAAPGCYFVEQSE
jgi:hypothetical protein